MQNVQTPPPQPTLDDAVLPADRVCTRCTGRQQLIGGANAMGKYACDNCEMVVGFDLQAPEPEFLIDRGQARLYTKDVFGDRLSVGERRVTTTV